MLGVIFLILGSLVSFACTYEFSIHPTMSELMSHIVMYALGTILSLVGTGFLLGVSFNLIFIFVGRRD